MCFLITYVYNCISYKYYTTYMLYISANKHLQHLIKRVYTVM